MSDRTYRLIFGALLLLSLYFDLDYLTYSLIAIMFLEGVTNWRIPLLVKKVRGTSNINVHADNSLASHNSPHRFDIEAERIWRLAIASMLFITYALFYNTLWFFPWFLGFAILGAGASGVCPGLLAFKWVGCK